MSRARLLDGRAEREAGLGLFLLPFAGGLIRDWLADFRGSFGNGLLILNGSFLIHGVHGLFCCSRSFVGLELSLGRLQFRFLGFQLGQHLGICLGFGGCTGGFLAAGGSGGLELGCPAPLGGIELLDAGSTAL